MSRADTSNRVLVRDKASGQWLLFEKPRRVIKAHRQSEVIASLKTVEALVEGEKCWAAGFISYEAAPAFDRALKVRRGKRNLPLVWFGIFNGPRKVRLPDKSIEQARERADWAPMLDARGYARAIRQVKNCIRRGETYQVNFTFRLRARMREEPWEFFRRIAAAHGPALGAFVSTGPWAICSFSPELFFTLDGTEVVCRPMKGTADRGLSWEEDQRQAQALHYSPKNRAENIMIVDMVRNDLGRVARVGSVRASDLFTVEKHPTVLQMTSTVRAETSASWTEILRALFPAASITGAPKSRTMQIIAGLENGPRGIYSGSIGFLGPGRRGQFNVAIRSAVIERTTGWSAYGVGGGITWDSTAGAELEEAFSKARVLLEPPPPFKLLESMLWTREAGFYLLKFHLDRLKRSADYFSFRFDQTRVLRRLAGAVRGVSGKRCKIRLMLDRDGGINCRVVEVEAARFLKPRRVGLAGSPVCSSDLFLYHKTTHRKVYEEALASRPDCDDVILWNERGELTESCIANLVLEQAGKRYTPPVHCGLLAGTCRAQMLQDGMLRERILTLRDLGKAERVFLINSVRGMEEVCREKGFKAQTSGVLFWAAAG